MTKYLTITELAENLRVSEKTLNGLLKRHGVEVYRVGRQLRVPESEVSKLLQPNRPAMGA